MKGETGQLVFLYRVAKLVADNPGIRIRRIADLLDASVEDVEPALIVLLRRGWVRHRKKKARKL